MDDKEVFEIKVPLNQNSLIYNRNSYDENEQHLYLFLSRKSYNEIFEQINKLLGLAFSKKLNSNEIKPPKYIGLLSWLVFLLTVLYAILLGASVSLDNSTLFSLSLLSIVAALSICTYLTFANFLRKLISFESLDSFIKEDIEKYLKVLNKSLENLEMVIDPTDLSLILRLFYPRKNAQAFKYRTDLEEIQELESDRKMNSIQYDRIDSHDNFTSMTPAGITSVWPKQSTENIVTVKSKNSGFMMEY